MNFSRYILFALIFSGAAAADDLDAALQAQKQRSVRRAYTESALLDDQNLTVPDQTADYSPTLEEQLQAMQNRGEQGTVGRPLTVRRPVLRPTEEESNNWLTPALLDENAAVSMEEDEPSWMEQELQRRKEEKEFAAREQELQEQEQRRNAIPQTTTPAQERLKRYTTAPQPIITQSDENGSPSYLAPQSIRLDPLKKSSSSRQSPPSTLFSPQASQTKPAEADNPFTIRAAAPGSGLRSPAAAPARNPQPEPETPIQRIRRSTFESDPFSDSAPGIRRSIWD